MKFYNRHKELKQFSGINQKAENHAQMTVIMGRRRVGKTQLLLEAASEQTTLYFFVARKAEPLLCQDFVEEIQTKLQVPVVGEVQRFTQLFEFLMQLSANKKFTVIIDEFQDFGTVNASIYSEMQRIWDLHHLNSKINLQLCGSVYSLMKRIFQDAKEPLFGRATSLMHIQPFETSVLKEILTDYHPEHSPEDLLALYTFTGGVAKYVQLLMDNDATTLPKMMDYILREESIFMQEGRNLLITEFGRDYAVYFSILAAIAEGKTSRNEIENLLNREIGGYLTRLEKDFSIIKKNQPFLSKSRTKQVRYLIHDPFLQFWFRFIYKYGYLQEIGNYQQLKAIIKRDYTTFSGKLLEQYFTQQLKEEQRYSRLGNYWDRKGENEIDLIAIDELNKSIDFYEIKRKNNKINLQKLKKKSEYFLKEHKELMEYAINLKGLSLDEV